MHDEKKIRENCMGREEGEAKTSYYVYLGVSKGKGRMGHLHDDAVLLPLSAADEDRHFERLVVSSFGFGKAKRERSFTELDLDLGIQTGIPHFLKL